MRSNIRSFTQFSQLERIKERFAEHGEIVDSGSGTIISPDGLVLTASHVVEGNAKAKVFVGKNVYRATPIKRVPKADVLLLKILSRRTDFSFAELIDCTRYPLGFRVFSLAFPNPQVQGLFPKYSEAYVAADRGFRGIPSMFQICSDQAAGTSGAGVFNSSGQVIGVLTSMLEARCHPEDFSEDVCFAAKSHSFYERLRAHFPFSAVSNREKSFPDRRTAIQNATQAAVLILACSETKGTGRAFSPIKHPKLIGNA